MLIGMSESPEFGIVPEFDLADRLRKALRSSDLSVQEMAEYLEVSRNSIGRWINGRAEPPGAILRLWALRTGVPHVWIRTGKTENPHPGGPGEGIKELPRLDSNQQPPGYASAQVIALSSAA